MNNTEAKLIILIGSLDPIHRNTHTLASKIQKSFSATYNYLRILEAGEYISRSKRGNGSFFSIKSFEAVEEAQKILSGED